MRRDDGISTLRHNPLPLRDGRQLLQTNFRGKGGQEVRQREISLGACLWGAALKRLVLHTVQRRRNVNVACANE